VALQEIQDNDGAEITDVIAADLTLQTLVEAIVAAGGPEYAFIDNPFIGNGTSGGQPGGNIRTAFLYDPDEVELVEGSVTTITDPAQQIAQTEAFGAWQAGLNPFVDARLPLVATFAAGGEEVTVVNNHFTSKGGSTPLLGAVQPPINGGEPQRVEQALAVNDFVADLLAEDRRANIVVAGDLNEFEFEEPLAALEFGNVRGRGRAELFNLTDELPRDERYSFIFEGNSQSLDHILVSRSLRREAEFDAVHVNSEFADVPERASDHDPLLARIELPGADWMLT
jgi:predicted extracellular nuclease